METEPAPFAPPFCPRESCRFHRCAQGWRYIRDGHYRRDCEPRRIQRYRCAHCRRCFSTQSFSTTYYLKRPELQLALWFRLLACSGHRQIAREARCAPTTAMRQSARLGRHALLFLAAHQPPAPRTEPLVIDGFESFAYSQYHPLHLNLAVGAESHFAYGFTHVRLRRKGRMTPRQRERRARLEARFGRPAPRSLELAMAQLLRLAAPSPQALTVRSDEHPAYPRALRRLTGYTLRHECTPSVAARTAGNPLFPVNLLDLLLRHNNAHLKRESIAFAKRHQAVIERAAVLLVWRNFSKRFSENHDPRTPAMRLGLLPGPLGPGAILKERLFPSRITLPEPWDRYYRRLEDTPGIENPTRHTLAYAF